MSHWAPWTGIGDGKWGNRITEQIGPVCKCGHAKRMNGALASRTVLAPWAARVSKTCLPPVNRDGTDKKAPPNRPNPPVVIHPRGVLFAEGGRS